MVNVGGTLQFKLSLPYFYPFHLIPVPIESDAAIQVEEFINAYRVISAIVF